MRRILMILGRGFDMLPVILQHNVVVDFFFVVVVTLVDVSV
jgi:hypothetical protein